MGQTESYLTSLDWAAELSHEERVKRGPAQYGFGLGRGSEAARRAVSAARSQSMKSEVVYDQVKRQAVFALDADRMSVRQISSAIDVPKSEVGRLLREVRGADAAALDERSRELVRVAWEGAPQTQAEVTISVHHFQVLTEMGAEYQGVETAREISRGRFNHPGDPFGMVISLAWREDPWKASLVMVSYLRGLREECGRLEIEPPTLDEVLAALPLALNEGRFADVDPASLVRRLRHDVPKLDPDAV